MSCSGIQNNSCCNSSNTEAAVLVATTGHGTTPPVVVDFGMKRQNSFDVSNPAGSRRIDGNPAGSDRIEIGAGLQSLVTIAIAPNYKNLTHKRIKSASSLIIL
ncbi:hypothetical protein AVEN_222733-1 [Araneus ventricosus]|uniref:Uncharacterized protein n=1 Tax=Araneus ventricosus TaxID=182803 RepID=A0A4Y2B0A3_ARAVE|nr:hypothetical protein AVEN_222733-1 [Araneus ventricosus]